MGVKKRPRRQKSTVPAPTCALPSHAKTRAPVDNEQAQTSPRSSDSGSRISPSDVVCSRRSPSCADVESGSTEGGEDSRSAAVPIKKLHSNSASPVPDLDAGKYSLVESNLVQEGKSSQFSNQLCAQVEEQGLRTGAVRVDPSCSAQQLQSDPGLVQWPESSSRPAVSPDSVNHTPADPAKEGAQQVPVAVDNLTGTAPAIPWSKNLLSAGMTYAKLFAAAPTMRCDYVPPAEKSLFIDSKNINKIEAAWGACVLGRFVGVQVDKHLINAAKSVIA